MKKILSWFITFFCISSILSPIVALAATSSAVQLEIIAPTTAIVGEAFDVTVRAVDRDNKIVPTYRGSVIFSTDNIWDTIPAPGKAVTFTADENGEKKISKGFIFKKSGKQKIFVYDVNDEIQWEIVISVSPANTAPIATNDQTVTIITPENGTKIVANTVTISGKTRKNSKVNIKLNGQVMATPVLTDEFWLFTKDLTNISQETNILIVDLIDWDNVILASSPEVKFTKSNSSIGVYAVTINPSATVEASSPISIDIDATPGLTELSMNIDGTILMAKESSSGKYSIQTVAPQKAGVYKLSIAQKDALGQNKTSDSPTSLTVTEKLVTVPDVVPPTFKNIKTVVTWGKIVFDFWVENAPADLLNIKIAYGKNADTLSQEVITYPLTRIQSSTNSGSYTWYVDKLPEDTYTFKLFGLNQSGSLISGFVSEPIIAAIGKDSCTIGNVGELTVNTDSTKSVISWESLSGAVSYNLYTVSAAGDYTLFQNVTSPTYTLFLSKGAITHDNFVVKALCDTKTESKEYSSMSRVQSGPGMLAFVVIIAAMAWAFLMRRRYN